MIPMRLIQGKGTYEIVFSLGTLVSSPSTSPRLLVRKVGFRRGNTARTMTIAKRTRTIPRGLETIPTGTKGSIPTRSVTFENVEVPLKQGQKGYSCRKIWARLEIWIKIHRKYLDPKGAKQR